MKFNLKQLILFVTIAAMMCAMVGFALTRVRVAEQMAIQARHIAEEKMQLAKEAVQVAREKEQAWVSMLKDQLAPEIQRPNKLAILHWNVDSGDDKPATMAKQLIGLGRYDMVGLSGVANLEVYEEAMNQNWPNRYAFVRGASQEHDRLLIIYDKKRFGLLGSPEMRESTRLVMKSEGSESPMYVWLADWNQQQLVVFFNPLASGDTDSRTRQAIAFREWARNNSTPMIALGDNGFDYDFDTKQGDAGFDEFVRDGVWTRVQLVERNGNSSADEVGAGDAKPDLMQAFAFVAGGAREWKAEFRVIERDGDFHDDGKTSDHRPVELILTKIRRGENSSPDAPGQALLEQSSGE